MPARILIDAIGSHEPQPACHMTVDGVGVLVDLTGLPGPLSDPLVTMIEWGPFGDNFTPAGRISRRSMNNATSLIEVVKFTDLSFLVAYLAAYQVRLAEALGPRPVKP